MSVTITSRTALTLADNAADFLVIDDTSAGVTKKITPDNLRDSMLTGSALTTVDDTTLTASRAVVSNASGQLAASSVTSTELGYLSGLAGTPIDIGATSINLLNNGNLDVWSKGTAPTATTDTALLPHWHYQASGGTPVAVAQQTSSPPEGSRYFLRFTKSGTDSLYWGFFQFIEAADAVALRGKTVSFSLQAKGTDGNTFYMGCAVWTGTADTLTSAIFSSFPTPTLVASYTQEITAEQKTLTTSWQTFTLQNIALDTSSFNNIVVFISTGGDWNNNETFDLAQFHLNVGATAKTLFPKPYIKEVAACQRVHYRIAGDASGNGPNLNLYASAGSQALKYWLPFPTEMRTTPTGTVGGTWALSNCTGPTLTGTTGQGTNLTITSSAGGLCTAAPNGTDDYLDFDAGL